MPDRQIPRALFAPWMNYYGVPGTETYLPRQPTSFAAAPVSWAAAMGSRAWDAPIFASPSWPTGSTLDAAGDSFSGAARGVQNGSAVPPDLSAQPSSGILPAAMTVGPDVPLSGPNGPIYRNQLTYAPEPPRTWGRRLGDALSDENVRYYLGPGFYDFYRKFADLAAPFSPGPGTQESLADASNAETALKHGDYGQAALEYGKSAFNLGSSIIPDVGPLVGKAVALGAKAVAAGTKALPGALATIGSAFRLAPDQLKKAVAMELAGASKSDIYFKTGVFRDIDGIWKYEIPDNKMLFTRDSGWGVGGRFSSVQHPELKKSYPNLKHVYLGYTPGPATEAEYRSLNPGGRPTEAKPTEIQITAPLSERHGATVHELQHAIQAIEDFPRGGLPNNAYDPVQLEKAKPLLRRAEELRSQGKLDEAAIFDQRVANILASSTNFDTYWRLAGEIEARNAQKRALWTPEKRLLIPPWESMDLDAMPPIVRYRVPPSFPEQLDWDGYQALIAALRKLGLL